MITRSPAELERLALLVEEAAEVQQMAMKIIRHGYESFNPFDKEKTPNRQLLEKELGDLLFAIKLMVREGDVNGDSIDKHLEQRPISLDKYLHENSAFKA